MIKDLWKPVSIHINEKQEKVKIGKRIRQECDLSVNPVTDAVQLVHWKSSEITENVKMHKRI